MQIEQMREKDLEPSARKLMEDVMAQRVRFLEAMDDDFNTAGAIGVLFEVAGLTNRFLEATRLETHANDQLRTVAQAAGGSFVSLARMLGLMEDRPVAAGFGSDANTAKLVDLLVEVRRMSREAKQFDIADHIRDGLSNLGIVLEDRTDATEWRIE
jgi:cysteinyl-tRNA synthetase